MDSRPDDAEPTGGLTAALAELEESTARIVSLRHKVERLAAGLVGGQEALQALEHQLATTRATAEHDRTTISRLERDVEEREEHFAHLRTELTAIAAALGLPGGNR